MSGSPSSDYGSISESTSPCNRFTYTTALQSPSDVVLTLRKGDVLPLVLDSDDGRPKVVVKKGSKIVGSFAFPTLQRLIECMRQGYKYEAKVQEIQGPNCRMLIQPSA